MFDATAETRDLSFGCSEISAFRNFPVTALQAAALEIAKRVFFRNRGKILRRGFGSRALQKRAPVLFREPAVKLPYRFYLPQQFLYFLPEPQGQGSLRPTLGVSRLNEIWISGIS